MPNVTQRASPDCDGGLGRGTEQGVLIIENVSKTLGAQRALDDVSIAFRRGERHALLGSNGAGKSTLAWLLAGRFRAYSGTVSYDGRPVCLTSRRRSLELGIQIVTQEPSLAPNLNVIENLSLGRKEPSHSYLAHKTATLRSAAHDFFDRLGIRIRIDVPVGRLPLDQRQLIDLLRAVTETPAFLIIDEPPLFSDTKYEHAFQKMLNELSLRQTGIILITHQIDKALNITDTVTVIRDGRTIASSTTNTLTSAQVYDWMFPRGKIESVERRKTKAATPTAKSNATIRVTDPATQRAQAFVATAGIILGLKTERSGTASLILRSIAGVDTSVHAEVVLNGMKCDLSSPHRASESGIFYLSSDREREEAFPRMSVGDNLIFSILDRISFFGFISRSKKDTYSNSLTRRVGVDARRLNDAFALLSGGNQQRILLGRMIAREPNICLLDEPNRGVDVASLGNISEQIRHLATTGSIVLVASTDQMFLKLACDEVLPIGFEARSGYATFEGEIH